MLFVSSLWRYKNADGLLRAWKLIRHELAGRQLVILGAERDQKYSAELHQLAAELGIAGDVVFVGGVPNEETVHFYRAADLLVYPSFNETFGLPILEAMACACPVVTSNVSSMPEIAGGAALLADPHDPNSIARSILEAIGSEVARLRTEGLRRAQQFTWGATAEATLNVYREAAERRQRVRVPTTCCSGDSLGDRQVGGSGDSMSRNLSISHQPSPHSFHGGPALRSLSTDRRAQDCNVTMATVATATVNTSAAAAPVTP